MTTRRVVACLRSTQRVMDLEQVDSEARSKDIAGTLVMAKCAQDQLMCKIGHHFILLTAQPPLNS
jgi:hypothetical protein